MAICDLYLSRQIKPETPLRCCSTARQRQQPAAAPPQANFAAPATGPIPVGDPNRPRKAIALASARARASEAQDESGAAGSSGAAPITLNDAVSAIAHGVPVIGSGVDELDAATNAIISH